MKKVREYSYWLNKNLPHKKMEYHSASLKTPKFACFDVPKKKTGLNLFKTQKEFLELINYTISKI